MLSEPFSEARNFVLTEGLCVWVGAVVVEAVLRELEAELASLLCTGSRRPLAKSVRVAEEGEGRRLVPSVMIVVVKRKCVRE